MSQISVQTDTCSSSTFMRPGGQVCIANAEYRFENGNLVFVKTRNYWNRNDSSASFIPPRIDIGARDLKSVRFNGRAGTLVGDHLEWS